MKVIVADSFITSLKRMNRHSTWWYKSYEVVRYGIPNFLKNIWRFRKELYSHHWWDYRYTLDMLYRSLIIMEAGLKNGNEVPESRDKKLAKIRRAIELLKHKLDDDYTDRAELELGVVVDSYLNFEKTEDGYKLIDNQTDEERQHSRNLIERAYAIENEEWNELWDIFKGQDINEYLLWRKSTPIDSEKLWYMWFDGSDMRGWWD